MAKWITSSELTENTSIGGNVDPDKYLHHITDVQVMVMENVLGTKLYDKIDTDFQASSLTGDYETMFNDYIKPALWHSVYAEYLKDGNVLAQNAGIFSHSPEDAQLADLESIKYSVKNAKAKADTYIDRLIRFLCDKNIAEYDNAQDNDYDIDPKTNIKTRSGWHL